MDVADGQGPEDRELGTDPDTGDEARTELIPSVETGQGIESTRELPAVEAAPDEGRRPLVRTDDPAGQRFESSPMPGRPEATPAAPPPAAPPAAAPSAAAPSAAAPPAAAPPPAPPADAPYRSADPRPGPTSAGPRPVSVRSLLTGLIVVLLVAVVAVAGWKIGTSGSDDDTASGGTSSSSSPAKVDTTVTSLDPSGGSGFRRSGSSWTTQTYTSATFGNLKKGVGLVLDLGEKQSVDEVTFTSTGTTVSLRAADSTDRLTDESSQVGDEQTAGGATTLSGDGGGEHRYWMIWVSRLAPSDGGFSAEVGDIAVKAG